MKKSADALLSGSGGPNIGVKTTKRAVTFHNNESGQLAQIKLLFSF